MMRGREAGGGTRRSTAFAQHRLWFIVRLILAGPRPWAACCCLIILLYLFPASAGELPELVDYVRQVLQNGPAARGLADELMLSRFDIAEKDHLFDVKWVPLANFGASSGTGDQRLGMEARQEMSGGASVATGFTMSRLYQDAYVLNDSHNMRGYVRVSQGLFRRWGEKYNTILREKSVMQDRRKRVLAEKKRQDLIVSSVQKYLDLLLTTQVSATNKQALERAQRNLEVARSRQAAGLVSKMDVYRAELAAIHAEDNLREQERRRRQAEAALYEEMGAEPPLEDGAEMGGNRIPPLSPIIPEDWQQHLLNNRPEWIALQLEREEAQLDQFRARRNLQPDVAVSLYAEQKGSGDSFSSAGTLDETNWAVQLEMRSPLDNLVEKNDLSRTNIALGRLRREEERLRRLIPREAREGFDELQAEESRRRLGQARQEHADQALDLARVRYERGLGDNTELLHAEESRVTAELDILRSSAAYNLAAVKLARALGVLDLAWLSQAAAEVKGEGRRVKREG
ncbi:MAG: hypothetical protein BWK76_12890 [Desulfobulbaceae bacterium A2]|nr:MAG: hypothetical protein BWK76_12890 [Desulfobulbaceae bacterium A2]